MVVSFFEDIFPYEKFPVEYECFKQLKNNNINYIAVPWTQILNSHWLDYPNKQPAEYYFRQLSKYKIQQADNFTVCQHDSYMALELYFKHLNITKVFSPLHESGNNIPGITILPIPFTSSFNFKQVKKDIHFSFIGTYTSHPIRVKMKDRITGPNIVYRDTYHVDSNVILNNKNTKLAEEREYQDILQRSRFSLCPRGSSVSSVRFWESIHAQAIPILISDNWVLPEWDWSNTILSIQEKDFNLMNYKDIITFLNNIPKEKEDKMRQNCAEAYKKFNTSTFADYIKLHL
jgi:hypothetical protein